MDFYGVLFLGSIFIVLRIMGFRFFRPVEYESYAQYMTNKEVENWKRLTEGLLDENECSYDSDDEKIKSEKLNEMKKNSLEDLVNELKNFNDTQKL
jgi:hypothetical protein